MKDLLLRQTPQMGSHFCQSTAGQQLHPSLSRGSAAASPGRAATIWGPSASHPATVLRVVPAAAGSSPVALALLPGRREAVTTGSAWQAQPGPQSASLLLRDRLESPGTTLSVVWHGHVVLPAVGLDGGMSAALKTIRKSPTIVCSDPDSKPPRSRLWPRTRNAHLPGPTVLRGPVCSFRVVTRSP